MADPRRSRRNPFAITELNVFEINEVLRQIRLEIEVLQNREHTHTGHEVAVDKEATREVLQVVESSIEPPIIVSNQHNYNPTGLAEATIIRVKSNASHNITGLKAQPDGTIKRFFNYGTDNIVLKNGSENSQRLNRFDLTSDITIGANETISVQYGTINNRARWRVIGNAGGSSAATSLPDGDYSDISVGGGGTVFTIDNDVVTYAKMQNVSAPSRLIGRGDTGSGDPQEIILGTNLTMTGTTLSASGGSAAHALLGATHNDTVAQAVSRGSLIYGNATPNWDELIVGASGTVLTSDGTDVSWATPSAGGGSTTAPSGLNEFIEANITTAPWEELIEDETMRILATTQGAAALLRALNVITVGDDLVGELQLLTDGNSALIYA